MVGSTVDFVGVAAVVVLLVGGRGGGGVLVGGEVGVGAGEGGWGVGEGVELFGAGGLVGGLRWCWRGVRGGGGVGSGEDGEGCEGRSGVEREGEEGKGKQERERRTSIAAAVRRMRFGASLEFEERLEEESDGEFGEIRMRDGMRREEIELVVV